MQNANIFATDEIFQELSLSQDGSYYNAQGGSVKVHLHEEGSRIKLYLPRKKFSRQYAFSKHVPERILQWLMTDEASQIQQDTSDKAVNAIKDVWNAPLEELPTTLDECGIMAINTRNLDTPFEEPSSNSDSDDGEELEDEDSSASSPGTMRVDPLGTSSGSNSDHSFTPDGTEIESDALPVRLAARSRLATPLEEFSTRDTHYVNVLGRVIAHARTSTIPDRSANQPSTVWGGSSNIHGSDQFERDCKVGAAGELFVCHLFPLHIS